MLSIIIPTHDKEAPLNNLLGDLKGIDSEIIISCEGTRAKSLNAGAAKATHEFLWFIHADSKVTSNNINALKESISTKPDALHYFGLSYDNKGLIALNAWGANLRSRFFGLPYGDQGFCISKSLFLTIGGYPENTKYGEDLLFIRLARQHGINLNHVPSKLTTSARKYKEQGWLKLTLIRQIQMIKLMRKKL